MEVNFYYTIAKSLSMCRKAKSINWLETTLFMNYKNCKPGKLVKVGGVVGENAK